MAEVSPFGSTRRYLKANVRSSLNLFNATVRSTRSLIPSPRQLQTSHLIL
jgi:hypothetical protein